MANSDDAESPRGDDDYFSSDLPSTPEDMDPSLQHAHAHPLSTSFGKLAAPALALFSGEDEYGLPKDKQEGVEAKWKEAGKGLLEIATVPGANHSVSGEEERGVLCDIVIKWLERF
jgi:hypothetical protein